VLGEEFKKIQSHRRLREREREKRERERRAARGGVNECSQQENEKEKNGAENGR